MNKLGFIILLFLFACKNPSQESKLKNDIGLLPKVVHLDSLISTKFSKTLDDNFINENNIIYASTLKMVFDSLHNSFDKNFYIENIPENLPLIKIVSSPYGKKTLFLNEYKSDLTIDDGGNINAHCSLAFNFHFSPEFDSISDIFQFKNNYVNYSRYIFPYDQSNSDFAEIVYYKNDENFIFKLFPKVDDMELIFVQVEGLDRLNNFLDIMMFIEKKSMEGMKDKLKFPKNYIFNYDDIIAFPFLSFNLETEFEDLQKKFIGNGISYQIIKVYQRNALLLNHKGGIIESEAKIYAAPATEEEPEIKTKNLIVKDDYFLIVKHKSLKEPFFCLKIINDELMIK